MSTLPQEGDRDWADSLNSIISGLRDRVDLYETALAQHNQNSGVHGGAVGPQGPPGPKGPPGQGVVIKGSVPTEGDLPPTGNVLGDMRIVEATGDGYIWDGNAWINAGQIRGPEGPQGEQGPQGEVGPKGDKGDRGLTGPAGPAGPVGPQGSVGPEGPQGVQGPRGFVGPEGPEGPEGPQGPVGQGVVIKGAIPGVGPPGFSGTDAGEMWLDVNGDGWVWDSPDWVNVGPVRGPEGPQGQQGPAGPQGEVGPEGPEGPAGPTGPAGPEGPEGVQGPAGPQGPEGPQGSTGAQGPQGLEGPQGPEGPSAVSADTGNQASLGSDSLIYVPKETDNISLLGDPGRLTANEVVTNEVYVTQKASVPPPTLGVHAAPKDYVDSRIWFGTQASYDAIGSKDPTVLYVVTG